MNLTTIKRQAHALVGYGERHGLVRHNAQPPLSKSLLAGREKRRADLPMTKQLAGMEVGASRLFQPVAVDLIALQNSIYQSARLARVKVKTQRKPDGILVIRTA